MADHLAGGDIPCCQMIFCYLTVEQECTRFKWSIRHLFGRDEEMNTGPESKLFKSMDGCGVGVDLFFVAPTVNIDIKALEASKCKIHLNISQ